MIVSGLLVLTGTVAGPAAQTPSLNEVMKNAAEYVAAFHRQFSGIAAEETYLQETMNPQRSAASGYRKRTLRSDLLLVRPGGADRYVELRDVFEIDGEPVRDRQQRLERLLEDVQGGDKLAAIIRESARYNIGRVERTVNTPLMPLSFLSTTSQSRFKFTHVENTQPVFGDKVQAQANELPVFKVSTEMWTVRYEERGKNTVIKTPDGRDLPVRGRFWINPATGAVLISELIVPGVGVYATITTSYQSEPLMGFLVPIEMRELYLTDRERITGSASYGRFRQIP
jgi:hypothetical protein